MKNIFVLITLILGFSLSGDAQSKTEIPGIVNKKFIKVMSYNMRIASPPSTKWKGTDLPAIAKVINAEAPDLVALQEVDAFTESSGKILIRPGN